MAIKDFDSEARDRHVAEGSLIEGERQFIFGGETLTRRRRVPAKATVGLGLAIKSDNEEEAATAVADSILSLITPDSEEAFRRAIDKQDDQGEYLVDEDTMWDCYRWLMSKASRRPPTPRSDSPLPPQPSGTSSTDASYVEEQTSPVSPSIVS